MVRKQAEWYDGLDLRDYQVDVDAPAMQGDAATVRLKSRSRATIALKVSMKKYMANNFPLLNCFIPLPQLFPIVES